MINVYYSSTPSALPISPKPLLGQRKQIGSGHGALSSALTLLGAILALLASSTAFAGVAIYQLGEQDFVAGAGPIPVSATRAAGANEAYPFNGTVFGDDRIPRFGRIHFTYEFSAPTAPGNGLLTLGLIGLDADPGSPATVRLSLNGINQPSDSFVGVSTPLYRSSASVVTVPVASSLLAQGRLEVTIQAIRASAGFAGNAIEADFSTLAIPVVDSAPGGKPAGGDGGSGDAGGPGTGGTNGNTDPSGPHGGDGSSGGTGDHPAAVPLPPALLLALPGLAIARWAGRTKKSEL